MTQNLKIEVLTGDISIDGMVVTNLVTKEELSTAIVKKADLGTDGKIPTSQLPAEIVNTAGIVNEVKLQLETSIKDAVDESNAYAESYTDNALSSKADLTSGKVPLEQLPAIDQYPQFGTALSNLSTSILSTTKQRTDQLEKTKADLGEDGKVLREQIPSYEKISGLPEQLEVMSTQTAAVSGELDKHKLQTADRIDTLKENIEANVQQLSDRQSHLMRTYATKELGVDAKVGVKPGEYFYVRSANEEEMMVEYQNVGGVATATGKSYLSAIGVQQQEKKASTIKDDNGLSQQEVNDYQGRLNTILNKTGTTETLAESVDATPFLQALLDAMPDGMTLDLLGKTFRVKKNTGFSSDYPNGDQPCLVLKANNITITNGKLIVKEHGQGILDSFGENLNLVGVTLQGAGNFPLLDGNTGRGEKGYTNGGYYNAALHNSGMPKNNSVNTSGLSTGGYGGNFPQWGGGTASTWGTWNGGFIFNEGSGLTVKGGSAAVRYCDISGFNGYGCLAEGGSLEVKQSEIHHIYTAGVHGKVIAGKVVDFLDVQRNNIHHIGHPDALNTNLYADPGYGVSTSNGGANDSGIRKYIVEHNNITFCRRKGVDAHHGYDLSIQNNLIEDCGTGINVTIYTLGKNPIRTMINGNTIRRIHHSLKDVTMGIFVECNANLSRFTGSAFVTNNKVDGVGLLKSVYDVYKAEWTATAAGIVVCGVHDATITGNTVDSTADHVCNIGIADGLSTALNTPVIDISHNTIRGSYLYGIFSIAGTNTTSNATIPNRGVIIGNKLDVTRRVDTAVNTYNIYSSPVIKVANNSLVERIATMQNYYQPNLEGQSVVFDTDVVAKNATSIKRSELISLYYTPVASGDTGQLRFTLPAGATIRNVSITPLTNLKSATSQDIRFRTGSTNPSSYLAISFYKIEGGSVVDVPVGDLTGGALTIRLDF